MDIQFLSHLTSALGLSVLLLLLVERLITPAQSESSAIAIPVKVREDG